MVKASKPKTNKLDVQFDEAMINLLDQRAQSININVRSYVKALVIGALNAGYADQLVQRALDRGIAGRVTRYPREPFGWESEVDERFHRANRYRYQGWVLEIEHFSNRNPRWKLIAPNGVWRIMEAKREEAMEEAEIIIRSSEEQVRQEAAGRPLRHPLTGRMIA